MLVHHAERSFIAAGVPRSIGDSRFTSAKAELEWIVALNDSLGTGKSSADVDTTIRNALAAAAATSAALLRLLRSGRDRFGNAADHVPRLSLAEHKSQFLMHLKSLVDTERERETVHGNLQQLKESQTSARRMASRLAEEKTALASATELGMTVMKGLLDRLVVQDALIADTKEALTKDISRLKLSIKQLVQIDLNQLFQTLESLAFMPAGEAIPATMWLSQSGKTGMALESGQMLHFGPQQGSAEDYVLRALAPLAESVQTLSAGYEVVQGLLSANDKGAALVLATASQIEAMLQPLWSDPTAQQLRLSMRHFKDAVLARNQTLLEFNGHRSRYLAGRAALMSREIEAARMASSAVASFGEYQRSNAVFDALGRAVERAQNQALASIFGLARSYRSWSISSNALELLGWTSDVQLSSLELRSMYDQLHAKAQEVVETRAKAPTRLPKDVENGTGIWIYLDESNAPEVIRQLKTLGHTTFSIAPARRGDTFAKTPFHGLSEVQLLAFRPFVGGLRVKGGQATVRFEHEGAESIVSRTDEVLSVRHAPIGEDFKFETDWATHLSVNNEQWRQLRRKREGKSSIVAEPTLMTSMYQGLSPFAQWRIHVPRGNNEGLDLKAIYCLAIECHVEYVPFIDGSAD
jgi:hypothetical protein